MRRTYTPWSPSEVDTLARLTAAGATIREIAQQMGRSPGSIQNKQADLGVGRMRAMEDAPPAADPVQVWESRRQQAIREVEHKVEVYDWLRPVELPAPPRVEVTETPNRFTVAVGDMHFPQHDPATLALVLQTVEALKPERIILNGDTVDLLAVSKYPKDARKQFKHELRDEVRAFHGFLRELHAIGDRWGLEVVETESNHAGNGTASRWWRYLSDRCPELLGHDEAEERLSYQSWFYPKWSSIRLVEDVVIADDLLVIHGDIVRKNGGYSARAHGEKWQSSTLNNHTHRQGASMRRVPAVGSRPEGIYRNYEIGCACLLNPGYASVPDWTSGFAVIAHDATQYAVELVTVNRGRCAVAALGKSLAA